MRILIDSDKSTRAYRIQKDGAIPINVNELNKEVHDVLRRHLICMVQRPGITRFLTLIEYLMFAPGTDQENDFSMSVVMWQGISFWVVSFPEDCLTKIEECLGECGLVSEEGVPTLFKDTTTNVPVSFFPISSETVKTIENHPSHPIYKLKTESERVKYSELQERRDGVWARAMKEMHVLEDNGHPYGVF